MSGMKAVQTFITAHGKFKIGIVIFSAPILCKKLSYVVIGT
jgi:hypothetical protein